MRTIERDIVAAAITSADNKLFLGKKDPKKGGVYIDCWHIPGGGVEDDESKEAALQREVAEETGIDVTQAKVWLVDDDGEGMSRKIFPDGEEVLVHMEFTVYGVHLDQNADDVDLELNDDLVEGSWFTEMELEEINLTPPSVELLERVGFTALLKAQT